MNRFIILLLLIMSGCIPQKSYTEARIKQRQASDKREEVRNETIKNCIGRTINQVVLDKSEGGVTLVMDDGSQIYLGCYKYSINIHENNKY